MDTEVVFRMHLLRDQTHLTCSSDKIRVPLNIGISRGVNLQLQPRRAGETPKETSSSSRTHGRPTSMAFSHAYLRSLLKYLVQVPLSLADVRKSERLTICPKGSSSKVSQPRQGREAPLPCESMAMVTNCLVPCGASLH